MKLKLQKKHFEDDGKYKEKRNYGGRKKKVQ